MEIRTYAIDSILKVEIIDHIKVTNAPMVLFTVLIYRSTLVQAAKALSNEAFQFKTYQEAIDTGCSLSPTYLRGAPH